MYFNLTKKRINELGNRSITMIQFKDQRELKQNNKKVSLNIS